MPTMINLNMNIIEFDKHLETYQIEIICNLREISRGQCLKEAV